jgi:hypothetical protein
MGEFLCPMHAATKDTPLLRLRHGSPAPKSLHIVPVGMKDEAERVWVLSALGKLRSELQGRLGRLVERRSGLYKELQGLDRKLQALDKEIESQQRQVELVEATERQMGDQVGGQSDLEGDGELEETSTQVGGSAKLQDSGEPVWLTGGLCLAVTVRCHASGCPQAVAFRVA